MPKDSVLDLAAALGAQESSSANRLALYIPDRDKDGVEIGNQRRFVLDALKLLARIGGGATNTGILEGVWRNPKTDELVWDKPVLVYSYVQPEEFIKRLPELRELLHRMGRETNQGEVAVEFAGVFHRITQYDAPKEAPKRTTKKRKA